MPNSARTDRGIVMKIGVIGDGGWGTALAILLSGNGHDVTLWSAFPDYVKLLREKRENVKFLPGVPIPDAIEIVSKLDVVLGGAGLVVTAVPSPYMREALRAVRKSPFSARLNERDVMVVNVSKGLEAGSLKRLSEVLVEELGDIRLAVLSGPSHAEEVARRIPTTVVVASGDDETARKVQEIFMTDRFRVYTNTDVLGVELAGALKNVIAVAAGMSDGLGFGDNTKAALVTRGIAEIERLGVAMGARPTTFSGLAGLGDLVTTCISGYGRNRRLGMTIARGVPVEEALAETPMVAEGYYTVGAARALAEKHGIEMPITEKVHAVLYEGKDPAAAVKELMERTPRSEVEHE